VAQPALAVDGSTGGEKTCRQSRFPRKSAQKSRIIQAFVALAKLSAPEALAVGQLSVRILIPLKRTNSACNLSLTFHYMLYAIDPAFDRMCWVNIYANPKSANVRYDDS
jgi:hypothetical protein